MFGSLTSLRQHASVGELAAAQGDGVDQLVLLPAPEADQLPLPVPHGARPVPLVGPEFRLAHRPVLRPHDDAVPVHHVVGPVALVHGGVGRVAHGAEAGALVERESASEGVAVGPGH